MIKSHVTYLFFSLILLASCNSGEPEHIEANLEDITDVMDTIEAKITFHPLTTKSIFQSMNGAIQGAPKLKLEPSQLTDSSAIENYLEEATIAQVTYNWADLLKQTELKKAAKTRLQRCTKVLWGSLGNIDKSIANTPADTLGLNSYFQYFETQKQSAYFEALSWLENLYVSVQLHQNVSQKTKYNQVIMKQLNRGDELLSFLYDYQDYKPISTFSQEILEVIDCKNYELNVTQLKEVVIDCRKRIYHIP